jgi:hypothetical protein
VLHAPRQTGKTTFLKNWMRQINEGGEAIACYVSVESCQGITERAEAMITMSKAVCEYALSARLPVPELPFDSPELLLYQTMRKWAGLVAPKPLIVLFDEADVLEGEVVISFLRQLRSGFPERKPGDFPISIALVGMRDLKDYLTMAKDGRPVNPGSPFNIKQDSAVLSNFSRNDIERLFAQRTEETGQMITTEALDFIYEQTWGQPWLVNSLFQRATMRILDEDSRETVTLDHIQKAREQMILARETHLDSLAYRLEDPGIRKLMETLFTGAFDPAITESDAWRVCIDLGLVRLADGTPSVANPIYRETIARHITFGTQVMIPKPEWQWEKADGSLDMEALMREFQKFWRKNSEIWEQKYTYTEAFPHLLLQAFLQRVLNGGGRIEREYAAGRGRMDLAVEYNKQIFIIEIKLVHSYDSYEEVRSEGKEQIKRYRDKIDGKAPSWLLVFDRRSETKQKSWDEKLSWTEEDGITVLGL